MHTSATCLSAADPSTRVALSRDCGLSRPRRCFTRTGREGIPTTDPCFCYQPHLRQRTRRIPIVDGVAAGGLIGLRLARPFWFRPANITDWFHRSPDAGCCRRSASRSLIDKARSHPCRRYASKHIGCKKGNADIGQHPIDAGIPFTKVGIGDMVDPHAHGPGDPVRHKILHSRTSLQAKFELCALF